MEVKSIKGPWNGTGVLLSKSQFEFAQQKKGKFWIYVVENMEDQSSIKVHKIKNPVSIIDKYQLDSNWHLFAEKAKNLIPKVGLYIQDRKTGIKEKITEVKQYNKLFQIKTNSDTGFEFLMIKNENT